MKFFTSLLAGLASTTSIEGHLKNALLPEETGFATIPIGNGLCQAYDGFTLFNLKTFQPNLVKHVPLSVKSGQDAFVYNLCSLQTGLKGKTLQDSYMKTNTKLTGKSLPKSSAFWTVGDDVKWSFTGTSIFDGMENKTKGAPPNQNVGFNMNWNSTEKTCVNGKYKGPFKVTLHAHCEKDTKKQSSVLTSTPCHATWELHSSEACGTTIPITAAIKKITPFLGFIAIVVGLIMTFRGAQFIQFIAAFVVGLAVTAVVFGIGYNCLPTSTHVAVVMVVLAVAIALGVLAAKLGWNVVKSYVVPIVAGAGAVAGVLVLCGAAKIDNKYAKIGLIFVGILAGVFLGNKFNKEVKSFGTAFVGAFLTVRGISTIFGGWPGDSEMHHLHHSKKIFAYLATFIVLFIGGALVQRYTIRDEDVKEGDDNYFAGEDEGRTCGCF